MSDARGIIVVDIGNSAIKLAIARRDQHGAIELVNKLQWLHGDFNSMELEQWAPHEVMYWCIASVQRGKTEMLKEWIASARPEHPFCVLTHADMPLSIQVDAPEKVGIDRLLAAVGANHRRSAENAAITITVGTAVTVNAIDSMGAFIGGAILPGWPLLAKSLHQYTDALPLVNDLSSAGQAPDIALAPPAAIGKNTREAIRSGLYYGLRGAVEALVEEFEETQGANMETFIAGGDAALLRAALGWGTLAPDLVLEGAALVAFARTPAT